MNIEFSKRYLSIWDAHKIMIVLIRSRRIGTSIDLEVAKRLLSPGEIEPENSQARREKWEELET